MGERGGLGLLVEGSSGGDFWVNLTMNKVLRWVMSGGFGALPSRG
jgi:hypothetical protein